MRIRALAVAVVTLAFLALALRGTDVHALVEAWRGLPLWRIGLVVLLHFVVLAIRTQRFRHLVPQRPAFGPLLAVMAASFLAINVVPLRVGELVRPYLLAQRGVPLADATLAVVIERLLDLVALLVLVLLAAFWVETPTWHGREALVLGVDVVVLGRASIGGAVLALLLGLFVVARIARTTRGKDTSPSRWHAIGRRVDDAFVGLARRSKTDIAFVLLATLGSWLGALAACGLTMGGFPTLETTISTVLVDWAATVSAAVLVPTPGFIGAFEAGAVAALVMLGRDADAARAFALALHAIQLGSTLMAGVVGFAVLGVGLPTVVRASRDG